MPRWPHAMPHRPIPVSNIVYPSPVIRHQPPGHHNTVINQRIWNLGVRLRAAARAGNRLADTGLTVYEPVETGVASSHKSASSTAAGLQRGKTGQPVRCFQGSNDHD